MRAALKIFTDNLPRRPYCTNDPHHGQTVRGKDVALSFANIQPNTSGKVVWLSFDVDHTDGATSWDRLSAPPPTLAIENPANGHAHLLYALEAPVPRTELSRAKPLLYLAAAQEGIRRKLQADAGYSGHLCKNPLHPRWQTRQWAETYTLAEISDWVDLPRIADMKKVVGDPEYAGLGRNCELFEQLRQRAYRLVKRFWIPGGFEHYREAVRMLADDLNSGFAIPLPLSEVRAISGSCARWIWKHFDSASFRAVQSVRGSRKGATKRESLMPVVLRLIGEGKSQREVAAAVGVGVMTVNDWLKRQPA